MGDSGRSSAGTGLDVWLRGGGRVVASSERAARAVTAAFHRARRAEGLSAWPAPEVDTWTRFIERAWHARASQADRLVMNAEQEQALWAKIISNSRHGVRLIFEGPRHRMAKMAMKAHELLCACAPKYLKQTARSNWQQDSAAFSAWLVEFDHACARDRLVSAARLPGEVEELLAEDANQRPELLLVGFDRLLPIQQSVLQAWGGWHMQEPGDAADRPILYRADDEQRELAACASWCEAKLAEKKDARLLVVTQDLPARRGQMERAFLRLSAMSNSSASFEFTLGVPLSQVPLARAAYLLMRWLAGPLNEQELDWLLGSGKTAADATETYSLTGFMRALRHRQMERTHWSCGTLLEQQPGAELPIEWAAKMRQSVTLLAPATKSKRSPVEWADFVPELLRTAGWPGGRPLTSEEFQVLRRWKLALDTCASLGYDGMRIAWSEFVASLGRVLEETLFAPESQDAAITIAGPAESAGLEADAIWFMGVGEDAWPTASSLDPLLPVWLQREVDMPHAKAQTDWDLAESITKRLISSAAEVCFSFAGQIDGSEQRGSRLVKKLTGDAQQLPAELLAAAPPLPMLESNVDSQSVPLAYDRVAGGSTVLSEQSQCPFKAFATTRLAADGWEPAQAGLTAAQRGTLLHAVLHSVWGSDGVHSRAELNDTRDLEAFVNQRVRVALASWTLSGVRDRMPKAYLALEEERLTRLVTEWLRYELTRLDFAVVGTETKKPVTIAGLSLQLRVDRIDRLNDGSYLVMDYKTGDVKTNVWDLPRPEDVQLPLYACFALDQQSDTGGLVFAKVRSGQNEFVGRVINARTTLLANGIERKALAKNPLTVTDLEDWRASIEQLATDFLSGRADVDPIDRKKICERCDLQSLCRIAERGADLDEVENDDEAGEEAGNE